MADKIKKCLLLILVIFFSLYTGIRIVRACSGGTDSTGCTCEKCDCVPIEKVNCGKCPGSDSCKHCACDTCTCGLPGSKNCGTCDIPDIDEDGIPDEKDNCKNIPNKDQSDRDNDGSGDKCDNCPDIPNPAQADADLNGIGNACDKMTYYRDKDGDGYGSDKAITLGPGIPPRQGYVRNSDDCNDNDPTVHPDAKEICDKKDNDCDGEIDKGCGPNKQDVLK